MAQEEYIKSLKEWREQVRNKENKKYMEKYKKDLKVGDYVYVKCDGPGTCTGRIKEITDDGITVNVLFNEKVEERYVDWLYVRADFVHKNPYTDLVWLADEKYRLTQLIGKECTITTSKESITGKVIEKLSDAIIIETESEQICIMDVDVSKVELGLLASESF